MPYADPERQKQAMEAWNKKRKAEREAIVLEAKAVGCRRCGEMDPACLDFHHVGTKTFEVSKRAWRNLDLLRAEIAECVVLCANCHRKLHAGRFSL